MCTVPRRVPRSLWHASRASGRGRSRWGSTRRTRPTRLGTILLFRVLLVLWTVYKHGRHGSFEHPRDAYSWLVAMVCLVFGKPDCGYLDFAACSFGAPFQKPTRLGLVRCEFLRPLARPCVHGRKAYRRPLVGAARTAPAAAYTDKLCAAWAELTRAQLATEAPLAGPGPLRAGAAGRLEQPSSMT